MKLAKKNLIYSLILAGLLMFFILSYFIFMLPSLYVNYVSEQNLKSVKNQHRYYLEHGDYDEISVMNPAGCFTLDVPLHQDYLYMTNKAVRVKFQIEKAPLTDILHKLQKQILTFSMDTSQINSKEFQDSLESDLSRWGNELSSLKEMKNDLPFSMEFIDAQGYENLFQGESSTLHPVSDDTVIMESSVHDDYNGYTNYLAITVRQDRLIVSYLPILSPKMNEILPIVMQSVPMIAAVLVLLVLLFSLAYSKGIVNPIVSIANHTQSIRSQGLDGIKNAHVPPMNGCLEITTLGETLNELYGELQQSYTLLQEKNQALEKENERKEVFLRASSHQLKTPIAAALLLLDGMMNQIGRYKDTATYLPQVKQQLISMKNIVDDILYLNHCDDHLSFQSLNPDWVLSEALNNHAISIEQKHLHVEWEKEKNSDFSVESDYSLLSKIIDNLLANAVAYTPEGQTIQIQSLPDSATLEIKNYGVTIAPELLPHIYEPFVSSHSDSTCHGLGLYIVSYYAKKIHITVEITNFADALGEGVLTQIHFTPITLNVN